MEFTGTDTVKVVFYSLTPYYLSVCVVIKYLKIVMMIKDEGPIRCQHEADDDQTDQDEVDAGGGNTSRQSHN